MDPGDEAAHEHGEEDEEAPQRRGCRLTTASGATPPRCAPTLRHLHKRRGAGLAAGSGGLTPGRGWSEPLPA